MKITTKMMLLMVLTVGLLLSCSAMAGAEMLFGVSAEYGFLGFVEDADTTNYPVLTDFSGTPGTIILTGELNLLLVRLNAEYGMAQLGSDSFYLAAVKAGWELGLPIFKAKAYAGYRAYGLTNEAYPHLFWGLVGSLGVESKLSKFKFYGDMEFPLFFQYSNGITPTEYDNLNFTYLNLGVSYAPLPLIDVFVNYRAMGADSSVVDFSATGATVGVRVSL